ncbi:MAG: hypothetical protein QM733_06100 [Ilumatobacteraceae bacterium]
MIIVIAPRDGGEPGIGLDDADNCNAFHLEARGVDAAGVAATLAAAGAGRVAGDDAFVERAAIERMAADAGVAEDWNERYQGMLAYAGKKGWLDADGLVQAHIEWR